MNLLAPLAFLAFIALGLPDGILGVAWPSMRQAFGAPLDALGLLLLAIMAGYVISSFACGKLLARMGVGTLLSLSTLLTAVSLLGYAVLPVFPALLLAAALAGLGGGAVDSALNTYAAFRFQPRSLNWLHASYSLGAFLGPATVSLVLAAGLSWRWAYVLVAAVQGVLGTVFWFTRRRWVLGGHSAEAAKPAEPPAAFAETLRLGKVWISVLAFFLYTGLEFSVGQWSFTLLTEGRGLATAKAALWVSGYWGAFTGGRVLAGLLPLGDRSQLLLRLCPAGMLAGAALAAFGGTSWATPAGLALLGLFFAPVYPAMVALTPARLGARHAANAMGFQVAAATVGLAVVPALIGVVARRWGLESIGQAWVLVSLLVWAVLCLRETQRIPK